jgi:hypothetical protein
MLLLNSIATAVTLGTVELLAVEVVSAVMDAPVARHAIPARKIPLPPVVSFVVDVKV